MAHKEMKHSALVALIVVGLRAMHAFGGRQRLSVLSLALGLCLYPAISTAQQQNDLANRKETPAANQELRLEDLLKELLQANPELQAARKRHEAALTRPSQESALPDPRITAGWISNGSPLPGAGLGTEVTSNVGIQAAQEIPFPGKRALKGGIAQKEADSEAQSVRATELKLVSQLKQQFYELRFIYDSIDLLRRNQALLQQLAKVAEARYSVGKAMQQDIIKASIEVSILENRLIALEQRKRSLGAEINALLNRSPGAPLGKPESAAELPSLEPIETLEARAMEGSPVLRAQQAMIASRELNVQYAKKSFYPDFDVMTGYYNQGSMKPMWEFKVEMSIPLYYRKKQQYGLQEAGANLVQVQRMYRNEQQMILFRLRDSYVVAEAARKLMDLYSRQVVPQSELALKSSLASYDTGGVDFLTVLSNFTTIRDYQMNYYEQQSEYLKALSRLEELTGY